MKTSNDNMISEYESSRRAKGIAKLVIGMTFIVVGTAAMVFANDIRLIACAGAVINMLGFFITANFILEDKQYVFPAKRSKS